MVESSRQAPAIASVRAELPATQSCVYLNTGTYGPLPRMAVEAIEQHERADLERGRARPESFQASNEASATLRGLFAQVVGARDDEIALTYGTSHGMDIALWGLDWREGDELVTTNVEHIGGLAAPYILRDRFGVVLRFADCTDPGRAAEEIRASLSPRTRAIVMSHVSYSTGEALPVAEVGRVARERDALLIVDGAQSAGATPVAVHDLEVDAYAIPGQKWLCGPGGTGALFIAGRSRERFRLTFAGYASFADFDEHGDALPHPSARRFELGNVHTPLVFGAQAALRWLLNDLGLPWIFERTQAMTQLARRRLAEIDGIHVTTSRNANSPLTHFTVRGWEPAAVVEELSARG
ncbi:MAG TPA: aminotransferase class V-fold PLP-dependent enzyme, partial [Dehalococcoidia bacterium]|nr:aminotransferase class V-fold PLP-dependent enzyme [Dehalococcoidia bacterium]